MLIVIEDGNGYRGSLSHYECFKISIIKLGSRRTKKWLSNRKMYICSAKDTNRNVQNRTIYNCPQRETTQMSISSRQDKWWIFIS